ncbi:MAG: hypothetical protein ABI024_07645 [Vicinamibacterales bacterium]
MTDLKPNLWAKADAIAAVAMFVTAFACGLAAVDSFTNAGNRPEYYRSEFAPAVLLACGHGFVNPPHQASSMEPGAGFEALGSFLHQQQDSLECRELPRAFRAEPLNLFQATHRYLMTVAASVWMVTGVSWSALKIISALFYGLTASLVYLLARSSMGRALSLAITATWITSPVQLEQLPHLRDYAKAPFFMFTLCAVAWIALTRASRRRTITALAVVGAVLGVGFGFRTDVVSYLPFVLFVVMVFRPGFSRTDLLTRGLAATAAVGAFIVTASPILRAYQSADNVAHVAMLGLSDPSRDWLELREAPYSYGYLYHDEYLATVIAGYSERQKTSNDLLLLGTPDYTKWGDDYYRRLVVTFPGDMLVRAWAAALGVFQVPFQQVNLDRPNWIDPRLDFIFQYRGSAMSWLGVLPPFVAAGILAVGVSVVSLRLFGLLMLFGVILPGMTSIQFHERHVFHLEVLSLFTYGCLLSFGWRLVRRLNHSRSTVVPIAVRTTVVAFGLAAFVVLPVCVARLYQASNVARLFSAYESAEVTRIDATQVLQPDGQILLAVPLQPAEQPEHFIDTNVLVITVGGDQCDADVVPLRLRYRAVPHFVDLTRQTIVPAPAAGQGPARLLFPVYSLGARSRGRESPRFVGVEVAPAEAPCIQSLARFKKPDKFPLLLESMLLPDWRQRPLYEALRGLEPPSDSWRIENYSIPHELRPGGRWLSELASDNSPATYRSPQVRKLDDREIEVRGNAASSAAYLLSWGDASRAKGSVFFVEGELFEGGLTAGIQANEKWVQQVNVLRPGRFRVAIQVEEPGAYGAVLANNQQQGLYARIIISRYGWLPPAPATP